MRIHVVSFLLMALSALSSPLRAATQTVTLSVPGMTCAACPITIKMALSKVPGVSSAAVSYERLEAVVSFDDSKTNVEKLIQATKNAGYPSSVKK